jgi:hypothetical protein
MKHLLFFVFLFCLGIGIARSQNDGSAMELLEKMNALYGQDELLIQGRLYPGYNRSAEGDPFFPSASPTWSKVFVAGVAFHNIPLLWDTERGCFVLESTVEGQTRFLMLTADHIDSIHQGQRRLAACRLYTEHQLAPFVEVIMTSNEVTLLRTYDKHFVADYSAHTPSGRYSTLKTELLLLYRNESIPIKRWRDFSPFVQQPSHLKSFARNQGIRLQRASNSQLKAIIQFAMSNEA